MKNKEIIKFSRKAINLLIEKADLKDCKVYLQMDNLNTDNISIRAKHKRDVKILINPYYVRTIIMKSGAFGYCRYTNDLNLNSIEKRLLFGLAHELGHLIQWVRHKAWFAKFSYSEWELMFMGEEGYRELKVEANADKIARILFKKCSDVLLTNV